MKILASLAVVTISFLAQPSLACDGEQYEQCMREKAEEKLNKKFPKYLSWKECQNVTDNFMTNVMESMQNFRSREIDTRYKGPLKNVRAELDKQKAWLDECDVYIQATKNKRVFGDQETTLAIYTAMQVLNDELGALIDGATYTHYVGEEPNYIMNEKFDLLFQVVDNHKTLLQLKGQYVSR